MNYSVPGWLISTGTGFSSPRMLEHHLMVNAQRDRQEVLKKRSRHLTHTTTPAPLSPRRADWDRYLVGAGLLHNITWGKLRFLSRTLQRKLCVFIHKCSHGKCQMIEGECIRWRESVEWHASIFHILVFLSTMYTESEWVTKLGAVTGISHSLIHRASESGCWQGNKCSALGSCCRLHCKV